jgi:hypothetical protein
MKTSRFFTGNLSTDTTIQKQKTWAIMRMAHVRNGNNKLLRYLPTAPTGTGSTGFGFT